MSLALNVNELLDLETVDPSPIWGPAICTHNIVIIYGDTGVGKTYVCMKLAHTIASTGVWLQYGVTQARKILYIDGELGLSALRRRYKATQASSALSPKGEYFRVLSKDHCGPRLWNIADPKDQLKYNQVIGDAEVIIFDNLLSCTFPLHGRDDEVAQWQRILPWLHALRDSGRTVILVHHTGKSGDQIGSSVKTNWADTIVALKSPEVYRPINGTEFTWHWKKTRDVKRRDAMPMHVEFLEGEDGVSSWFWRPLEENRTESVQVMKQQGASKRDVAKALGLSYREVNTAWEQEELGV